jgi:heme oxygenase (mycobilin-producing)
VEIYMKMFITAGTNDYLIKIKNKHPKEVMVTMLNEDGALLLHETNNETVFKEPRRYEIIGSNGSIEVAGFVVINYVPVTDEGRPLFEYQFKNGPKPTEKEQGFSAMRFLRPLSSNTYIILSIWESEKVFKNWQSSKNFNIPYSNSDPKIFASSSYVRKYHISE